MNKKQQVREIVKTLLAQKEGKLQFHREDLETAIMKCRGCDKRTLKNWWKYLWMLGFFKQPLPECYELNLQMLLELEVELPDIKQTHLLP